MKVQQGAAGREGSRARGFLVSGPEPAAGAWVPWAGFDSGLSEAAATSSSAGHGCRNNNFSKKFLQKFTENFRKKNCEKNFFFLRKKRPFPSTPIPRRRRGTHLNNNVTIIKIQKVYQEKIFIILEKKMEVLQGAAGREGKFFFTIFFSKIFSKFLKEFF